MCMKYLVSNLFFSPQFQYGGDSQKGPVISSQEAQAQAILQQTKVRHPNCLWHLHTHLSALFS